MILDISDNEFKSVFHDKNLFLPIRWDGDDFAATLRRLYNCYLFNFHELKNSGRYSLAEMKALIDKIESINNILVETVNIYLRGFPADAYSSFEKVMMILARYPIAIYSKSETRPKNFQSLKDDPLCLFRAAQVPDNKPYRRSRIFHTPYNMRSKVGTNRYSIAGYPSLYLGTSLELCCKEIHVNVEQDLILASEFKLDRDIEKTQTNIRVIELAIKPQDFLSENNDNYNDYDTGSRTGSRLWTYIHTPAVRYAYLLWYPLIAACSYIRINKNDPFAAEYIIPQLLMQWIRSQFVAAAPDGSKYNELIGIRYFSCASERASDMGFNYVFPTSGDSKSSEFPYCKVLTDSFLLTEPVYIHEYRDVLACEKELRRMGDWDYMHPDY